MLSQKETDQMDKILLTRKNGLRKKIFKISIGILNLLCVIGFFIFEYLGYKQISKICAGTIPILWLVEFYIAKNERDYIFQYLKEEE